jgi:hypothetical protein
VQYAGTALILAGVVLATATRPRVVVLPPPRVPGDAVVRVPV